MKIYHNPRCSKSREVLTLVKTKTSEFEIIEYLKNPLTFEEIAVLLSQLNITPLQLVRVQESIWKDNYKQRKMKDDEIINAIVDHPKLMERPIVVTSTKAIIGRPPENILSLFD